LADVYENNTTNKTLEVEIMHKSFYNMTLCPPYSGTSYKISLKPGATEVVVKK